VSSQRSVPSAADRDGPPKLSIRSRGTSTYCAPLGSSTSRLGWPPPAGNLPSSTLRTVRCSVSDQYGVSRRFTALGSVKCTAAGGATTASPGVAALLALLPITLLAVAALTAFPGRLVACQPVIEGWRTA
jgi:hypothetical protein